MTAAGLGLVGLLAIAALGCQGLSGDAPRAQPTATPSKDSGTSFATDSGGVTLYASKCQRCHGLYQALETSTAQPTGQLGGVSAEEIKARCLALPALTSSEMTSIVAALAPLKATFPSKHSTAASPTSQVLPMPSPAVPAPAVYSLGDETGSDELGPSRD